MINYFSLRSILRSVCVASILFTTDALIVDKYENCPSSTAMCDLTTGLGVLEGSVITQGWNCSNNIPVTGSICNGNLSSWFGVTCDDASNIIGIKLTSSSLYGTIPSSVGQLSSLTIFDIEKNDIYGTIPETISYLTRLTYLNIGYNQITGNIPSSFGFLSSLTYFGLFNNDLQGSLLSNLGLMTSLISLDVSNNNISGSIPTAWGAMISLSHLDLSLNSLQGTIPADIALMSSLQEVILSYNRITGTVPTQLFLLPNLNYLHVWVGNLLHCPASSLTNLDNDAFYCATGVEELA